MTGQYLAVTDLDEVYLERSEAAVQYALANELNIRYYAITIDPDTGQPFLARKELEMEETTSHGERT